MAYDLAKVTTNGNNLIAQILANKSSLSIDKIEISDTQLPSTTDISTMTSVPKVVQTVSANGFSKNSNTLIVSTVVDNSSIRADYKAWVFGIWGSDSQNGQSQLIAVITSTNSPDTIPAFSGRTPVSYTYKFNIGFSNASQIKFKMINGSFATNDTVVHTTGDETIDGQKKFKTDPTDSAGNAYAKTVDVNQQLDKKVNVADMRKPASDVAGIEEVNVKQDKIGYTPADDSKVVHSTDTSNWQKQAMFNPGDFKMDQTSPTTDFATLLKNKYNKAGVVYIRENNGPSYAQFIDAVVICEGIGYWYAYGINQSSYFVHRQITPSGDTGWVINADNSKVVHNSGNETIGDTKTFTNPIKGTIDGIAYRYSAQGDDLDTSYMNDSVVFVGTNKVAHAPAGTDGKWAIIRNYNANATNGVQSYYDTNHGILYFRERSNTSTYTPWIQVADDSKVAHLSGANNFDTVPTVNNNSLLLASSLPSDLARTGQANTFTQPQTFSIAPTITDASTDKGDNQAATMADLKSVENSAWHLLKTKDVGGDFDINMLYFKNYKSNYIRIIFLADSNVRSKTYSDYRIVVDMSKVITSFSESSSIQANLSLGSSMTGAVNGPEQGTANFVIATISGTLDQYESVIVATDFSHNGSLGDFRQIDFKVNGFI